MFDDVKAVIFDIDGTLMESISRIVECIRISCSEVGDNAFEKCSSLTTMIIPAACTEIGSAAFRECSGLARIEFPAALKKIGGNAFAKCASLREIAFSSPIPPSISSSSFKNVVTATCIVSVPRGAKRNYAEDKTWKKMAKIVEQ